MESTYNFAIVVAFCDLSILADQRSQRKPLTEARFNGRTCGRNQVAELVAGTDDESSEATWRQFHEMNRNDTPGTLDTL